MHEGITVVEFIFIYIVCGLLGIWSAISEYGKPNFLFKIPNFMEMCLTYSTGKCVQCPLL
jgi:hypothetical protein